MADLPAKSAGLRLVARQWWWRRAQRFAPGVIEHLVSAELHARGLDRFTHDAPSLLTSVCLFDWDSGRQIWPLPRPPMAAAFAATFVPAHDPANWANDYERRAAAQQAERQRMAQYYERLTKDQEERNGRAAEKRSAASDHHTADVRDPGGCSVDHGTSESA